MPQVGHHCAPHDGCEAPHRIDFRSGERSTLSTPAERLSHKDPQSKVRGWVRVHQHEAEVLPSLEALEDAVKKRSDALRHPPRPLEKLHAPALDALMDTHNPLGINVILEVCVKSIQGFSDDTRNKIKEVTSIGPRQCLCRCAVAALNTRSGLT
jgi:hypothetical protein